MKTDSEKVAPILRDMAELLRAPVLELTGEVGGPSFHQRQVVDHLRDAGPVMLRIASSGGNADHGHAIYQSLKDHPHPVAAVIEFAGSAATIAAMGARHRVMHDAGHFFLHGSWQAVVGNAASLAVEADRLAEHDAIAVDIYAEATGQAPERIRELLAAETTLTAQQCIVLGFAHGVIRGDALPPPDASWALTAASVARMAAAHQQAPPDTIARVAEGHYKAVMSGPINPRPAPPDTSAEDRAELRRRHFDLFRRTERAALRSLVAGSPFRPVDPYWRCECGARNYSPPAKNGRPSLCHHERKTK